MKNVAGPPVEGEDFWGRETELQMLVDLLQEGRSVLLVAQRRIGKTSLMRETARRLQDQCLCLMVNVENCASTAEAITEISAETRQYAPAWEKAKQVFGNILKQGTQQIDSLQMGEIKATFRAGLAGVSWQDKGERLFEGLAKLDRPVVILMDEVPILIGRMLRGPDNQIMPEGRQEADLFLSWLRSISLKYQPCICFVVTGSIGLGPILKQASLSATVNHLSPFDLKPWDRDVAYRFLDAIAPVYKLTYASGSIDILLDQLGIYIPYHVQLFFEFLYRDCRKCQQTEITPDQVRQIYDTDMLGVKGHAELSHLEERLKLILGSESYPFSLDLLTESAVTGSLTAESVLILAQEYFPNTESHQLIGLARPILEVLEHDGYLVQDQGGYRFESKLLQDWWKRRYQFFCTPASQRGRS